MTTRVCHVCREPVRIEYGEVITERNIGNQHNVKHVSTRSAFQWFRCRRGHISRATPLGVWRI